MKRVAIIPARGGSKRLARKNIMPFHGKPIIHYAIETARATRLFQEIFVSTDDEEISTVAMLAGCGHVIRRPAEFADDHATTGAVMRHAVQYLLEAGAPLEQVACIYPCTPLMMPADLVDGFNLLMASGKAYVFSVAEYAPAVARALIRWDDGSVQPLWPRLAKTRTQDLEKRYYDAGQWYWGQRDAWANELEPHHTHSIGLPIERWRAIDIDTYEDWRIAEAVFASLPAWRQELPRRTT